MFREVFHNAWWWKIFLHHMPARKESWEYFLHYSKSVKLDFVVCLTCSEEISEKSHAYSCSIKNETFPCDRYVFEIKDYGVPNNLEDFYNFTDTIYYKIRNWENWLIHCKWWIGRTGMFAMCLLQRLWISYEAAVKLVTDTGSWPETPEQEKIALEYKYYIKKLCTSFG